MKRRILGIDPGSRKTGFAVIDCVGKKLSLHSSGILIFHKIPKFINRLGHIHKSCLDLIDDFSPDEVAFESLIYVKSVSALSKLAQARGAMISAFSHYENRIFEYSPNLIKSAVTGYGHSTKESVAKSINLILGNQDFKSHDESDAIAIAICHCLNRREV